MMSTLSCPTHPAADIFPMLDGDEYAAFKADIATHGQRQPICLMPDGVILDGRNRWRACAELGLEPKCETYHGDDPIGFVISLNLNRRHLSESQRAMIAARLADLPRGRPKENGSIDPFSQAKAAAVLNVSVPSIKRAHQVLISGDDELIDAVDRGDIAVSRAAQIVNERKTAPVPNGQGAIDRYFEAHPDKERFICSDCGELFDIQVWHCPVCHHHWQMHREDCWNCHEYTRPEFRSNTARATQTEQRLQQIAIITGSSETNEWHTPAHIIALARQALGEIDLDPASSAAANAIVQASSYYTSTEDGYARPWGNLATPRRVWLNPPYGKEEGERHSNTIRWSRKLITEYEAGRVSAAILLVKAALGYNWFEDLWYAYTTCFVRERLSFIRPNGDDAGESKHATALVYLGNDIALFTAVFRTVGRVIPPERN